MEVIILIGFGILFFTWFFWGREQNDHHVKDVQSDFSENKLNATDKSFKKDSKSIELISNSGTELFHHDALIDYHNSLQLDGIKDSAKYNELQITKSNDYAEAILNLSRALDLYPNDFNLWLLRGVAFYKNNEASLACSDWKKAEELGSEKACKMLEQYCKKINIEIQTNTESQSINKLQALSKSNNNNRLIQFHIPYLYHMTHKNNLEKILLNGLLSHNEAHKGHYQIDISDNEVNIRRGKQEPIYNRSIHEYVPLYFNPKNPMLFKRKNIQNDIVILAFDSNLLFEQNVLFTDGNAASHTTIFYNSINHLSRLNWQCIKSEYWNDYIDGKRIKCAEVLVYPRIEVSSIKKIYCNNPMTLNFVKTKVRTICNIASEINNNFYFNRNSFLYNHLASDTHEDLPF